MERREFDGAQQAVSTIRWGPYIKDVRREGGVGPKADIVREVLLLLKINPEFGQGGGGPRTRKLCGSPLSMALDKENKAN